MTGITTATARAITEQVATLIGGLLVAIVGPFSGDEHAWSRIWIFVSCIGGLVVVAWQWLSLAISRDDVVHRAVWWRKQRRRMMLLCFFLGTCLCGAAWQSGDGRPKETVRVGTERLVAEAEWDQTSSAGRRPPTVERKRSAGLSAEQLQSVIIATYCFALGGWFSLAGETRFVFWPLALLVAGAVFGLLAVWWLAV